MRGVQKKLTTEMIDKRKRKSCQQIWNWKIKEKTTTSNCMRKRKKTSPVDLEQKKLLLRSIRNPTIKELEGEKVVHQILNGERDAKHKTVI